MTNHKIPGRIVSRDLEESQGRRMPFEGNNSGIAAED
jgi:hypothetical protein